MSDTQECFTCQAELITIPHWEYDGEDGSYEPYKECPSGCRDIYEPEPLKK